MGRGCVFCSIVAGDAEASLIHEDDATLAFMDIHPARPGHALIIPRQHAQYVAELDATVLGRIWTVGTEVAAALRRSPLPCDDLHFLLNDGAAANQTVPHVHLHVVPRLRGDLARLLLSLLKTPLNPVLGAESRTRLDRQARVIAASLADERL